MSFLKHPYNYKKELFIGINSTLIAPSAEVPTPFNIRKNQIFDIMCEKSE